MLSLTGKSGVFRQRFDLIRSIKMSGGVKGVAPLSSYGMVDTPRTIRGDEADDQTPAIIQDTPTFSERFPGVIQKTDGADQQNAIK